MLSFDPAPGSAIRLRRWFEADLKIRQLRILVALQELGQVQKVADALHVTQPAISKQLRELESTTGIQLFHRHGNRIAFTVAGERLANRAGEILQQLVSAEIEVAALAKGLAGTVVVGTVTTAAQVLVPQAIVRFRQMAPKAGTRLVEAAADELFALLDSGKLDIVVARGADESRLRPISSSTLVNDPLLICVRAGHPLTLRPSLDWSDLARMDWIIPAVGSPAHTAFLELLDKRQLRPHAAVESISMMANIATLASSDLLALLPLSSAKRLAQEQRLAILPLATDGLLAEVTTHWREDDSNPLTPIMAACLRDVAREL